jgi:hypothetical protein
MKNYLGMTFHSRFHTRAHARDIPFRFFPSFLFEILHRSPILTDFDIAAECAFAVFHDIRGFHSGDVVALLISRNSSRSFAFARLIILSSRRMRN